MYNLKLDKQKNINKNKKIPLSPFAFHHLPNNNFFSYFSLWFLSFFFADEKCFIKKY